MVVECLQIERAVDVQVAAVRDGVSQRRAVLERCTTQPRVGGIVRSIALHPVEDGQLVDGQLIAGGERLTVVQRSAQVLDAVPDGVFPCRIAVGIEVFVDGGVGLFHLGMSGRLEIHVQVLGDVPTQLEVAVEKELLVELQRQVGILSVLQVALLMLRIVAGQLAAKGNGLRQIVEADGLGEVEPLRLALQVLEGFPRLVDRRISIVQCAAPLVVGVPHGGTARGLAVRVAVAEGEVGRVVGHGMPFALDSHPCVGHREVARDVLRHGNALDGVALVARIIQRIGETHIRVERIVSRTDHLLRVRVVDRHRDLGLLGEELAQLHVGCDGIGLLRIGAALHDTLFQSTEAVGHIAARQVHRTEVGQLDVHGTRGRPSTVVVGLAQSQLVDPHLTRLQSGTQVAHTDDHGLHLAERRIAHDTDAVVRLVGVVVGVQLREARLRLVSLSLQVREDVQIDVEHVLLRPDNRPVARRVPSIVAGRRQLQGNRHAHLGIGTVERVAGQRGLI